MTEPSAMRPSTRSSPSDPAFPTRRALWAEPLSPAWSGR